MGLLNGYLKTFVGDKAKKDLKLILPIVDEIKNGVGLEKLSNDELRQRTCYFREKLCQKERKLIEKLKRLS